MSRAFFRNAGVLAVAQMLASVKGFVVIPLLTHRFHAVGYGAWAQVGVLVALMGPVIMLGTDSAVIRYLPGTERDERTRRFVGWMLAIALLSAVTSALVVVLRHPLSIVAFGTAGKYEHLIPLAAASIMATILLNFARTWFRLENDALRLSAITLGQAFLSTIALVLMFSLGQGLYQLILYSIAGDVLLAFVMLLAISRRTGLVRPDFSILSKLLRYGIVLLPAGYAIWALNWADRLFLIHYDDLRAVGLYSLSYSLGYVVIQLVVNPIWMMFPNAAAEHWNEGRRTHVQRLFESTAGVMLALVIPAIAGSAVLGVGLLRVLAPAEFAGAAPVLPLVLAAYLCFMLSAYYETVFGLVNRQAIGAAVVGGACGLNIALNFVLIPRYSYTGAAVATFAAFAAQLAVCMFVARRLGVVHTPVRKPARIVAAALGMTAVLIPFRDTLTQNGAGSLLGGVVIGACVYGILCRLLGVLPAGMALSELRRLLRRRPLQATEIS